MGKGGSHKRDLAARPQAQGGRVGPEGGEAPGHVSVSGVDEVSEELGRKLGLWTKLAKLAEAQEDEMLGYVCKWRVDMNATMPTHIMGKGETCD